MNEGKPTGFVGVTGYARGGAHTTAQSTFECEYEAGIGCTMLCAVAIAGALAKNGIGRGFETPVCALGGEQLRQALAGAGVQVGVTVEGAVPLPEETAGGVPVRRARL
jgi:short subunit dehydrogenase-like uncharacterized protein